MHGVEVAPEPGGGIAMRDPFGETLHFTMAEWQAFANGMRDGEFDYLLGLNGVSQ